MKGPEPTQDGTVANLPEYLVAENLTSLNSPVALSSKLTYFHFVLSAPASGSSSYAYAIFTKPSGKASWYKSNSAQGYIVIHPTSNFVVSTSMEPLDFYLAILFNGNTSEGATDMFGNGSPSEMSITLQSSKPNGINFGGASNPALSMPNHHYRWNPTKDYQPGTVYKVSGQLIYEEGDDR